MPNGGAPMLRSGEAIQAAVSLSDDAYLYCYYQDGAGSIARIFPNRFSPDAFVPAGSRLAIPDSTWPFDLIPERAGSSEYLACFASRNEVGMALPDSLKVEDLMPLPLPTLNDLVDVYQQIDPETLAIAGLEVIVTQ